jgi:nucleoid-associated protein EbfC
MGLGDFAGMFKQFRQMQSQMQEAKDRLEEMEVEGSSGGGMVVARTNGKGQLVGLTIDPQVVDPENVSFLEDLVMAAVRQAVEKSHDLMQQELGKAVGGIPGLGGLMGK